MGVSYFAIEVTLVEYKYSKMNPKFIDLTGKRFGRYVALRLTEGREQGGMVWLCRCDCGTEKIQSCAELIHHGVVSCGCYQREIRGRCKITHGHTRNDTRTAEFSAHLALKQRCYNPNNKAWRLYGGKGIKVCERWLGENGFHNFLKDMGSRPSPKHSIDRLSSDKDYKPSNCKWRTKKEQARNISTNRMIEIDGAIKCIAEWAEELGMPYHTVYSRVRLHERHGIPACRAISELRDGQKFVPPIEPRGIYIKHDGMEKTQIEWARFLGLTKNTLYGRIKRCRIYGLPIQIALGAWDVHSEPLRGHDFRRSPKTCAVTSSRYPEKSEHAESPKS